MAADAANILAKYKRRLTNRRTWESKWQELAEFLIPHRSNIITRHHPGQSQTDRLMESTGVNAAGMLAGFVHSAMTNPAIKWHTLKMRDESLNRKHNVRIWLEESNNVLLLNRNQSNFTSQIFENYLDQVVFGTANIMVEPLPPRNGGFVGLTYRMSPIGTYVIDEDHLGIVDTFEREFTMSARNARKKWPKGNLGEDIDKALADNNDDKLFVFMHSIHPRVDRDENRVDAKNLPIASVVITRGENDPNVVVESGFHEMPVMVPRWDKTTGEVYGRGRGMIALPNVKTLNRLIELELQALSISVTPPILVRSDSTLGKISLRPGVPTVVDDVLTDIKAFEINPRLDLSTIQKDDLKNQIRNDFFVNLLINREGGVITATEVLERIQEQQRLIGPAFGRQENELLDPMIDREFGILFRAGQIPRMPPEVAEAAEAGEGQIDVQYEGPLARGQRSQEIAAFQRWMELIAMASQINPNAGDIAKVEKSLRDAGRTLGLPDAIMNSPDEIQEIQEQRQQIAQEQQQKQDLFEGAGALGKAAPALELIAGGQNA